MAFITGTAANHTALWNTLLDFLQNNATLVATGQQWTIPWQVSGQPEVLLQSPSGALVALKRQDGVLAAGESVIWLSGATGVTASATEFTGHVNSLTRTPAMFLDQNPMGYWMVANGRRFVVVVKVSTTYQAMYGGFFLPYSNPLSYPMPLFVGGSRGFSGFNASYIATTWRNSEADYYRHFTYPLSGPVSSSWYDSSALMLKPDATWAAGSISQTLGTWALPKFATGPRCFPRYLGGALPNDCAGPSYDAAADRFGFGEIRRNMIAGLNGEMPLTPITLMEFNDSTSPAPVTYGILDGCFSVPGNGNAAENLITIGGVNHLVVPNVQRTSVEEYWALRLE